MKNLSNLKLDKFEALGRLITRFASDYQKDLKLEDLEAYANELMDMDLFDLRLAMDIYTSNSKNEYFPSAHRIKSILIPQPREFAVDAVGKIVGALRKFSEDTLDASHHARKFIGEFGWMYVLNQGGWWSIKNLDFNMGAQAQAREWLETQIRFKRMGIQGRAHSFESCLEPVSVAFQKEEKPVLSEVQEKPRSLGQILGEAKQKCGADIPEEMKRVNRIPQPKVYASPEEEERAREKAVAESLKKFELQRKILGF